MKALLRKIWGSIKDNYVINTIAIYINLIFRRDEFIQRETSELRKFYTTDMPSVGGRTKRVIYMVDGRFFKCGLSDRIRGAVFTYMACRELGVEFYIKFDEPFELSNYLVPNSYDWSISRDQISYNSTESEPLVISSYYDRYLKSLIDFRYIKRAIERSDKSQIHIYSNCLYRENGQYSNSFNELFKPTKIVQDDLQHHALAIGGSYINVTLRFQSLLGDFEEGDHYKSLSDDEQKIKLIERCTEQIEKLHANHPTMRMLVTSDSRTFLNHIDKFDYTYTIDGELVHMAFTTDNSINIHKKAFVDYLMIAGAERVYLLCTGNMFPSGFPFTASLINDKPFKMIKF